MGKRKPRARLTAEQAAQLIRDYQAGVPVEELAVRYSIDRRSITVLRQKLGVPGRRRGGAKLIEAEDLEETRRLLGIA